MSYRSKYIIVDTGLCYVPIIFGEMMSHSEMAKAVLGRFPKKDEVSGAGFVLIDTSGLYHCYGESVSLKVKSRGQADSDYLNKYLGNNPHA